MRDKYKIDVITGYAIDVVAPETTGSNIIEIPCDKPFYKAQWNGEAWVEGATQEYIDSLTTMPPDPTETERIEALEQALLEIVLGGVF